jgi:hypothetical protein
MCDEDFKVSQIKCVACESDIIADGGDEYAVCVTLAAKRTSAREAEKQ